MNSQEKASPAERESQAARRRERWRALLLPWVYMGSLVASVALVMALVRSCGVPLPEP